MSKSESRVVPLLIIVSLFFSIAGASPAHAAGQPVLFVADRDYPPINYLENDLPKGLCVDIVKALGKASGREMTVNLLEWSKAQEMVEHGEADALGLLAVTEERRQKYDFTTTVMTFEYSFFVRNDHSQITGIKDLRGQKIGVTTGGFPHQALLGEAGITLVPVATYEEGLNQLSNGTIQAFAADKWVALYYLQQENIKNINMLDKPFAVRDAAFAVKKGNEHLRDELNRALVRLRDEGTIGKILEKWSGKQVVFMTREKMRLAIVASVLAATLIVLSLLAIWIYTLKKQIAERKKAEALLQRQAQRLEEEIAERGLAQEMLQEQAVRLEEEVEERKVAQEGLLASEERYRHLFEQNPAPIMIYERGTLQILAVNQAFLLEYGYTAGEALALRIVDLYPKDEKTRIAELAARLSGRTYVGEWHHYRKNGTRMTIVVTSHDISYQGRNARIAVITDISEQKHLEEQLQQARKMESVGRLAGGVAHDFNNMLSVILGNAQISKIALPENDPVWRSLDQIEQAAMRSGQITRQLLAFSHKQVISPRPSDLNLLVLEFEKNLGRLIGEDVTFTFKPGKDIWTVLIDPTQMDQVLMNLSANARDAMPNGGSLIIETTNLHIDTDCHTFQPDTRTGDYVQLTVSDTGCGMDNETREHIFEPFFTTKGVGQGTGLGLATVYGIVTQNRGFITCYSEPGHGTVFRIHFPRFHDEATEEKAVVSALPAGTGTILLVEDEEMVLASTTAMLEHIGYTVIQSSTPRHAIEICEKGNPIDLILTDVVMPGMNGREMVERIKAFRPDVKVLFMSGYTTDLIALRGVMDAGTHFIEKPLDVQRLNEKIGQILGV